MTRAKFEDLLAFNAVLTVCRRAQKSKLALKLMEAMLGFTPTSGGGSGLELWASIYIYMCVLYVYMKYIYIYIHIYIYISACAIMFPRKNGEPVGATKIEFGNHMNVGESLFVR